MGLQSVVHTLALEVMMGSVRNTRNRNLKIRLEIQWGSPRLSYRRFRRLTSAYSNSKTIRSGDTCIQVYGEVERFINLDHLIQAISQSVAKLQTYAGTNVFGKPTLYIVFDDSAVGDYRVVEMVYTNRCKRVIWINLARALRLIGIDERLLSRIVTRELLRYYVSNLFVGASLVGEGIAELLSESEEIGIMDYAAGLLQLELLPPVDNILASTGSEPRLFGALIGYILHKVDSDFIEKLIRFYNRYFKNMLGIYLQPTLTWAVESVLERRLADIEREWRDFISSFLLSRERGKVMEAVYSIQARTLLSQRDYSGCISVCREAMEAKVYNPAILS